MKRADLDKRAQRDKFGAGKHGFQSGNPLGGVLPTIPGAEWFDHVQEEIANVIEAANLRINSQQYNQLLTAINKLSTSAVVNNLTSSNTDKPLSALQGKVLAEQIAAAVSGSLNLRGALGDSINLNDLTAPNHAGVWYQSANAYAVPERNYPVKLAGTLLVLPAVAGGTQIYIQYSGFVIWLRSQTGGTSGWGEWRRLGDDKLGNSGNQTLNGTLTFNNPNSWAAWYAPTRSGQWRFETNPVGDTAEGGKRFNFVFTGADNAEKARVAFPDPEGTQTVAYQSWVKDQIGSSDPINRSGIDLDTATTPQFFINAANGYVSDVGGEHAGLVLGYRNDCTQLIAAGGRLWLRGSDHNPISDPSHWSPWRRLLDDGNGVMLTGDQTIAGTKTFSGSLNTNSDIRAGGLVSTSYRNDWVGFWANQPTEGKHGFFDVAVNGVTRGGMQVTTHGNGRYHIALLVTPAGATNADRRVSGLTVYDSSIHTHAYGWLHEGFIRNGVGAGQVAGHQISLGWSSGLRLKAQVDNVDLGNIVFDSHFAAQHGQSGYQRLPNGLIIQWMRITKAVGTFSGTYNFPIAFPRACFGVSISNSWYISGAGNGYQLRAGVLNNSSFGVGEDSFISNGSGNVSQAFVIAIGN